MLPFGEVFLDELIVWLTDKHMCYLFLREDKVSCIHFFHSNRSRGFLGNSFHNSVLDSKLIMFGKQGFATPLSTTVDDSVPTSVPTEMAMPLSSFAASSSFKKVYVCVELNNCSPGPQEFHAAERGSCTTPQRTQIPQDQVLTWRTRMSK